MRILFFKIYIYKMYYFICISSTFQYSTLYEMEKDFFINNLYTILLINVIV